MTLNRENIQDILKKFYIYNTNNKKIDFVNSQKITYFNRKV